MPLNKAKMVIPELFCLIDSPRFFEENGDGGLHFDNKEVDERASKVVGDIVCLVKFGHSRIIIFFVGQDIDLGCNATYFD